jgi:PhzF family phenazine biosynthesis protein
MSRRFQLVDVFNQDPLTGNPLAVVLDADDLTTESMMRITRWLNLSETTFLLSPLHPDADYRVRIFTLDRELPFAGHPTLGTCHAWIESGGKPRTASEIVQECGAGLVPVRSLDNGRAFAAPNLIRSGPVDETKIGEVADFLRIQRASIVDAQWVDNGPGWVAILLDSAAAVLALEPPRAHVGRMDVGVVGPYPRGAPAAFELRAFFSDHQGAVREDPVTGSLNASVAQWLLRSGRASAPYTASQGSRLGHAGLISITQDALGAVWVGGRTTTLFSGTCSL